MYIGLDDKYGGWLWAVQLLLIHKFKCKSDLKLCPKSWKVYYDNGLNAFEAIIEDIKQYN